MTRRSLALLLFIAVRATAAGSAEYFDGFEGELFEADGGIWYSANLHGTANSATVSASAAKVGRSGLVALDTWNQGDDEAGNEAMIFLGTNGVGSTVWWRAWMRIDQLAWGTPPNSQLGYVSMGGPLTTLGYGALSLHVDEERDGGNIFSMLYTEGEQLDQHGIESAVAARTGEWHLFELFERGISTKSGEVAFFIDGKRIGSRGNVDLTMDGGVRGGTIGIGYQYPRSSTMKASYDELHVSRTPVASTLRVRRASDAGTCTAVEVALTTSGDGGLAGALRDAVISVTATGATLHLSSDCSDDDVTGLPFDAGTQQRVVFARATATDVTVRADDGNYLPAEASFTGVVAPASGNPSLYSLCSLGPAGPLALLALAWLGRRAIRARTS